MSAEPYGEGLVFVDTNVLVYAFDVSAEGKYEQAAALLEECWQNKNGCLSIQVLQEFFVTITRKIPQPLDSQAARQIIENLSHWRIQSPEVSDLLQAIDFQGNYSISFWDALVVQSATQLGCKVLYSEDLSHGQMYGEVRVVNPFR